MTTMRTMPAATLVALSLLVGGCGGGGAPASGLPADLPVTETINGQAVPTLLLELLARERGLDLAVPEQREQAVQEMRQYIVLEQEARKQDYAGDAAFAAEVELNRLQGIANATIKRFRADARIDDAALRAEYDRQLERAGRVEYDFSQLLFDNENDALKAAGEAVDTPFEQVMQAWRDKARQGNSFSRVRPGQLPEPLAKALAELKPGESSKLPVKTEFGWFVVHVSAVNPVTPPPFEEVRESIRASVLGQFADQRLQKLLGEAKIDMKTPPPAAAAAPAAATPAAPAAEAKNPPQG